MTIVQALTAAGEYLQAGRLSEAEALARQVLAADPNQPDALQLLAGIAVQVGRADVAIDLLRRVISLQAPTPDLLNEYGNLLVSASRLDEAIDAYQRAIVLAPERAGLHYNLGNILREKDRLDEAIASFRLAIQNRPAFPNALNNLGNLLLDRAQYAEATEVFQKAIELEPRAPIFQYNLARALHDSGNVHESVAMLRRLIAAQPDYAAAYNNLGVALEELSELDEAQVVLEKANQLQTGWAIAQYNLGNVQRATGQFREAIKSYENALSIDPLYALAHYNLGLTHLLLGEWTQGWPGYEWRWTALNRPKPEFPCPRWNGEPLNGKRVLIHAEQGYGDTFNFVRYLPQIAQAGGRVVFACSAEYNRLLENFSGIETIVSHEGAQAAEVSGYCPLMSVPGVMKTTVENVPASVPYIKANPELSRQWRDRLPKDGKKKVGIVWAGREDDRAYKKRSIPKRLFRPLAEVENVTLVSLQKAATPDDNDPASAFEMLDWTNELNDFADTAALIDNLDLVITIDSAVAHLAGAMGKAVWTLLIFVPDWRWLLEREDSVWYPTMRLFRQTKIGDWSEPIGKVVQTLRELKNQNFMAQPQPSIQQAITASPTTAIFHYNLGNSLRDRGLIEPAIASFQQALVHRPAYPDALNNLGTLLMQAGRLDEAIPVFRRAIELEPRMSETHYNLASALHGAGQIQQAIETLRQVIALSPGQADAYNNLGVMLAEAGEYDEARDILDKAISLKPNGPEAHYNRGNVHQAVGEFRAAVACFERALVFQPNYPLAHYNRGLTLLLLGDLRRGWAEYEWRWSSPEFRAKPQFPCPQWNGEPLNGRRLLLHVEQGLGDMIQFVRYAPLIARTGGKVIFACPPALGQLLRDFPGIEHVVVDGRNLPGAIDLHCPLLSVPGLVGTTLETIPATVPYLHADPALSQVWGARLSNQPGMKVGLVWAGRPDHRRDEKRSIALNKLAPIARVPGMTFISLQKGKGSEQVDDARDAGLHLFDWTSELNDFADTAGMIANLDLVISVDTAVAHLAGAMGKKVWVLLPFLPDWRWMLDREDSPWYPTMKLFRQPKIGDWETPINRVTEALREFAKQ